MRILAIDPGTRLCGAALFTDGKLSAAELVRNWHAHSGEATLDDLRYLAREVQEWMHRIGVEPEQVVIEQMQAYRAAGQKGDQNDLLRVAAFGGIVAGLFDYAAVEWYLPRQWKGTLPKPKRGEEYIVKRRVLQRLDIGEVKAIQPGPASLEHNVYDAIGLGLFHLGRFDARRAIAR